MTKAELLLDVIGEAQDEYIEELDKSLEAGRSKKRFIMPLAAAACIILVSAAVLFSVHFFPLGSGGGRCNYGTECITAGGYLYYETQDGIYRYSPESGRTLILGGFFRDDWYPFTANDYAFYYSKGDTIYKVTHGSAESVVLYKADGRVNDILLYPAGDKDIAAQINYNTGGYDLIESCVIIDGETGEAKTTAESFEITEEQFDSLDPDSSDFYKRQNELFDNASAYAGKISYTVGEYRYDIVKEDNGLSGYSYGLYRDGVRLLDEYDFVEPLPAYPVRDSLVLVPGRNGASTYQMPSRFVLIKPDGTVRKVYSGYSMPPQGSGEYLYYINDDGSICAIDADDDSQTVLITADEMCGAICTEEQKSIIAETGERYFIYDLYSDGEYIYLCESFDSIIACMRIEYDESGKPDRLITADNNILD